MPSPKSAVAALALLGLASTAAAGTEVDQAVRNGLPAYDPKAHTEGTAKETPAPVAPRPLKRLSDPSARLPEVKIVPGAVPAAPVATPENKGVLVLPQMTVTGAREKVRRLPLIFVQPPARNVPEPDLPDWETPAARTARLVKKHLSSFDQALNGHALPLIGESVEARALKAEAIEASARQLNNVADLLELSLLTGTETPEEQKKLRAEYWKAFYERPR